MKCQRGVADWFSRVFLRSCAGRYYFLPFHRSAAADATSGVIRNDAVFAMHLLSFPNSPKKGGRFAAAAAAAAYFAQPIMPGPQSTLHSLPMQSVRLSVVRGTNVLPLQFYTASEERRFRLEG